MLCLVLKPIKLPGFEMLKQMKKKNLFRKKNTKFSKVKLIFFKNCFIYLELALYGGLGIIPHILHNDWFEEGREAIRRKATSNKRSSGKALCFDNEPLFERISLVDTANTTAFSNTADTFINEKSKAKNTAEKNKLHELVNDVLNEEDNEENSFV